MKPRVISFDVFDTVLTRTLAEPHDLFLPLGERLRAAGLVSVAPAEFAARRQQAESLARAELSHHEPDLTGIYRRLAKITGWTTTDAERAAEMELALEDAGIRAVPGIAAELDRARRDAGRVVFISDTYLPTEVIRGWLVREECWRAGDLLFTSHEHGASKGRGELFGIVRQRTGAADADWLHRGDNPESDDAIPRRLGLQTAPCGSARLSAREHVLRGAAPFAAPLRSHAAGAARLARLDCPSILNQPGQADLWAVATAVAGPLFLGFTSWCLADAERRGLSDLYFLARGGQILHRIADRIQAAQPSRLRLRYLPASRLAFANVTATTVPLFGDARHAAAGLGFELGEFPFPSWLSLEQADRPLGRAEQVALQRWLEAAPQRRAVEAALAARREVTREFLAQENLTHPSSAALVDTGWHGTIQRDLEVALGHAAGVSGYYLGLMDPRPASLGPQAAYANTFAPLPWADELALCVLVELFAQADHSPLLGFRREPTGRIVPRHGPPDGSPAAVAIFQQGILAFVDRFLAATKAPGADPGFAASALGALREFHRRPTRREAAAVGFLPHSNRQGDPAAETLCVADDTRNLLRAMRDRSSRPLAWWLPGQAALGHAALLAPYRGLRRLKRALPRRR